MLLGHLRILDKLRFLFPRDAARNYPQIHIIQNWRTYFPNETSCPPVLYLDIWPLQEPIALVLDPTMCQDLVQERNQPRHHQGKHLIKAIASDRNLVAFDGGVHRLWRSRLNPGFSLRNLQSHMPGLVAELNVFVDNLKATAGKDGAWGTVFPLLPRAVDLTFDIIGRVVLSVVLPKRM
jgi:cytochrome P450